MTFPWLTLLAVLPLIGALLIAATKAVPARQTALVVSLLTLGVSVFVAVAHHGGTQFSEVVAWIRPIGAYYALDVDGMGLVMVLLTTILVPLVLIAEWNTGVGESGRWSARAFVALVLVLQSFSLFVFLASDVLLFYIFFEATLLPMYFLIGGWGGAKRGSAAMKFLIFGLAGGLVMLFSVIGLGMNSAAAGTPSYLIADLAKMPLDTNLGRWLFAGFFIAFAVKAPMVPAHTWLPQAAAESTPGGAALMVGVLDKIGTFGMIRFCLGLFPEASQWATPVVLVLALISIIYGAVLAIGSRNLMRLIAFTSISHFGFMVLGIFALTTQSLTGSIFYMVNHGFSTAALYLAIGYLIKRRGAANVSDFGGVAQVAPVAAGLTLVAGLSSLALPGMSSFVSEFLVMAGTWSRYPVVAAVATLGTVLSALYILLMYKTTMTGRATEQTTTHITSDLSGREKLAVAPLIALILFLGLFPRPALQIIEPVSQATMSHVGVTDPAPQAVKE